MHLPRGIERIYRLPARQSLFIGALGLALIGYLDYVTGYELSLGAAYLFPILLVSWSCGAPVGIGYAALAAAIQSGLAILHGHPYSRAIYFEVVLANRILTYLVIVWLASSLRRLYDREHEHARIDDLTNARNRRGLREVLDYEIERHRRSRKPLCVAYIDCDDFKSINDRFGHRIGDRLLQEIATTLGANVRRSDSVGRLGGDEFAIAFPETAASSLESVVAKLRTALGEMAQRHGWPVTFSIGVSACRDMPPSADALMEHADRTMYLAKENGKDQTVWAEYRIAQPTRERSHA